MKYLAHIKIEFPVYTGKGTYTSSLERKLVVNAKDSVGAIINC